MWSSRAAFSPKPHGYRICRWHSGLPSRGLGKSTKARKWFSRFLQEIQCHDQLAQILCNMAFSRNTSCVAPTSRFQVDQSRSEHQIFGFPNWTQHSSGDYDYTSYSLYLTKVDTLEFEKISRAGHIIVANQVLLATTLYILSCWTISKESIHQI